MLRNISILLLTVLLYSCGFFATGIEERAADYYSFQVGHLSKAKYSSFLSPAYLEIANKDALAKLDEGMRATTAPSKRYSKIKADQITVQQEGNFALTLVDIELGGAFKDGKPTRWVRDNRRWYIFLGSDAEVAKYGSFPYQLTSDNVDNRRPETAPPLLDSQDAPAVATTDADDNIPAEESENSDGDGVKAPSAEGNNGEPSSENGSEISGG